MDGQKFKSYTLAASSTLRSLLNLFLIFALVFLLSHCGKGGGPSAPAPSGVPSVPAEESAFPTAISGKVESLAGEEVGELVVEMVDEEGNELAQDLTKEDGTFNLPVLLKPSQSKIYRIRALRKNTKIPLEAAVFVEAGKSDIVSEINDRTTMLVVFSGGAIDRFQEMDAHLKARATIEEVRNAFSQFESLTVEQMLRDLLNPTPTTNIGALNELLEKATVDSQPAVVP